MRTAILVTAMHTLVSALVPVGAVVAELCIGMPLALERDYENEHGTIPKGTRGRVVSVDYELGCYWCLMDGTAPALVRWDNMMVLWAFETDELASLLRALPTLPEFAAAKPLQLAAC